MLKLCIFAAALAAVVMCVPLKHKPEELHVRGKDVHHRISFV